MHLLEHVLRIEHGIVRAHAHSQAEGEHLSDIGQGSARDHIGPGAYCHGDAGISRLAQLHLIRQAHMHQEIGSQPQSIAYVVPGGLSRVNGHRLAGCSGRGDSRLSQTGIVIAGAGQAESPASAGGSSLHIRRDRGPAQDPGLQRNIPQRLLKHDDAILPSLPKIGKSVCA